MLSILIEKLSTAPDAGLENTTAHKQFLAKFRKRANGPSEKVEFDHDVQVNIKILSNFDIDATNRSPTNLLRR